jgi:hypothetical protein
MIFDLSSNVCKANPCSLCWPQLPFAQCNPIKHGNFQNITLRNVIIHNPMGSPGVLMADENNPIDRIVFENVTVTSGESLSAILTAFNVRDIRSLFRGLNQPITDHRSWFYRFYLYLFILALSFLLFSGALIHVAINIFRSLLGTSTTGPNKPMRDDPIDYFVKRKLSDDNDVVLDMIMRSKGRYYKKQSTISRSQQVTRRV